MKKEKDNNSIKIEIDGDLIPIDHLIDLYKFVKKSLHQNKNPEIIPDIMSLVDVNYNYWEVLGKACPERRQFSMIKNRIDNLKNSDFLNYKCLLLSDKRIISLNEYCDENMIIIGIVIDTDLKLAMSIDDFGSFNIWKYAMLVAANYYTPGTKLGDWKLPSLEITKYILDKYTDLNPWLTINNALFGNDLNTFWTSSQFSMHSSYYCTGLTTFKSIDIKDNHEMDNIFLILKY